MRPVLSFPVVVAFGLISAYGLLRALVSPWSPSTCDGVVMFDDRLSKRWSPSGRLCSNDWFGDFSTYGLSGIAEVIGRRRRVLVNRHLSYEDGRVLDGVALLILKVPELTLAKHEVANLLSYVRRGGRVLLIGDHTDLFGSSDTLNQVGSSAGLLLRNDNVSDARTGSLSVDQPGPLESNWLDGRSVFELMSQCSVAVGWGAHTLLDVELQAAVAGDYSMSSNFGGLENDCSRPVGNKVFCAVGRLGEGQVVAWSDGTVWSTFALSLHERGRYFERLIDWMVGFRLWEPWCRAVCLLASMAGFMICIRIMLKSGASRLTSVALTAVTGVTGCLITPGRALPEGDNSVWDVCVVAGRRAAFPPAIGGFPSNVDLDFSYDTFLTGLWRLGAANFVATRPGFDGWLSRPPEKGCICVIEPGGVREDLLRGVADWVRKGGDVIVLVRAEEPRAEDFAFARLLGFRSSRDGSGLKIWGGRVVYEEVGKCGLRLCKLGQGRAALFYGAEWLSRERLGHCMEVPTKEQRARYAAFESMAKALGWPDSEQRRSRIRVTDVARAR